MRKYPFLILTGILIFALMVPFVFKLKDPRLEPYPAVIFPAGAGKVKTNFETVSTTSVELYGFKGEKLTRIPAREFFDKIPPQYLFTIVEGNFGLAPFEQEFKLYKPPVKFRITNNYTLQKHKATSKWIKKRLRAQGLKDSLFLVRRYKNTYHLEAQNLIAKDLLDEEVFKLD